MLPKVAIIYLSFHSDPYLDDFVFALKGLTYPKDRLDVVIVDNPHPTYGASIRAIEERVMPFSGVEIPRVTVLPQKENRGFSAGNNAGAAWAIDNGCQYVYFHNDDGFLGHDAIESLVKIMEQDETIAIAQSLLLLYPDTEYVNSAGNAFHYLGFGFCEGYRTPRGELKGGDVRDIGYASGAGMMARADLFQQHGGWDEDFFMYHEDVELSLRMRLIGYRVVLVPSSLFYHKYQFHRSMKKFYWMERNRYAVLLMMYRLPTLFLLLPMTIAVEAGLWMLAFRGGWRREKWAVYRYWLSPKHWNIWMAKRQRMQKTRILPDKELLKYSVPEIIFQEQSVEHPLLQKFGNPVMKIYWKIILFLVHW